MRIAIAGATGVLGRQLVPILVAAGHDVIALTRSDSSRAAAEALGAEAASADALDGAAVESAVCAAEPEVVIHQLTAIPSAIDPRRFAEAFRPTNRLRREGTRNLVSAARAAGARRIVVQSIAQAYAPVGGWVKVEEDPLFADAPPPFRETFQAVIDLEAITLAAADLDPVVLRYGNFYGPGTAYSDEGSNAELVRRGLFPLAGEACGRWSFVHVEDAARATLAAIERAKASVYNVSDDEPAAVSEWLPAYAAALGAPEPPKAPAPRSDYGRFGMLQARGASNRKARLHLDWAPHHSSWRTGFAADLGAVAS